MIPDGGGVGAGLTFERGDTPGVAGHHGHMHGRIRRRRVLPLLLLGLLVSSLAVAPSAAAAVGSPPTCKVGDALTARRTLSDWPRSILDTWYRLSSTYAPSDRVSTSNAGLNSGYSVRKLVIPDLKAMAAAAKAAGARFSVQSAYRSYATQKATFQYWVDLHGYAYALTESARAGHSEHQLGTTLDLRSYGGPAPWDVTSWETTKAGAWLGANAWKYGFVMSYPKGTTSVTCYMYEPWHFRYVGRTVAKAVHDSKLTLREYLWRQQRLILFF